MCRVGLALQDQIYLATSVQQQQPVEAAFSLEPVLLQNHLKRHHTLLACALSCGALSDLPSQVLSL